MRRFILLLSVVFEVNGLATAGEAPIELETESGKLEGTLTVPEAGKTWPVMLIVSGSGPTDRDGNAPVAAGRNNSLKLLAEALAGAGIASVRYDKRGIGESKAAGKPEVDLRFDDYVQDATDWSVKLSADRRFSRVGIIGHSEGATIALFVARRGGLASYVPELVLSLSQFLSGL